MYTRYIPIRLYESVKLEALLSDRKDDVTSTDYVSFVGLEGVFATDSRGCMLWRGPTFHTNTPPFLDRLFHGLRPGPKYQSK